MDGVRTLLKIALPKALRGLRDEDRLEAAWVLVCGRAMANQSRITGYDDGVVRIEVSDRAWLELMSSMRVQLGSELARIAGVKVNRLHFLVEEELNRR